MIFDKNTIFTLWIKNTPTKLNIRCWRSWVRLGYQVTIYCDNVSEMHRQIPPALLQRLCIKRVSTLGGSFFSFDYNTDNFLQQTDLWRFMYLKKFGSTWLDSDMYLLKRLPNDNIIISSEFSLQSGARKSLCTFKPNIGCLRFPPNNKFICDVVDKLTPTTKEDLVVTEAQTSKMNKFIKMLKYKKYECLTKYIVEPEMFCPIPWSFTKELYLKDKDSEIKDKHNVPFNNINENTVAVHLWENFTIKKHKIDLNNCHDNSIFETITNF